MFLGFARERSHLCCCRVHGHLPAQTCRYWRCKAFLMVMRTALPCSRWRGIRSQSSYPGLDLCTNFRLCPLAKCRVAHLASRLVCSAEHACAGIKSRPSLAASQAMQAPAAHKLCLRTLDIDPPLQIDKNVEREVLIHSQLQHPNVIGFKKVRSAMLQHIAYVVLLAPACH